MLTIAYYQKDVDKDKMERRFSWNDKFREEQDSLAILNLERDTIPLGNSTQHLKNPLDRKQRIFFKWHFESQEHKKLWKKK